MNKAELISAVSLSTGMKRTDTKMVIETTINAISNALAQGEKVSLSGLGTFKSIEKAARTGVCPNTHQKIEIPAKRTVKFSPSADIIKALK